MLASGSPRRLELLQQVGIEPARLLATAIDETPERSEHPRSLAKRLSKAKALKAYEAIAARGETRDTFVLGADTVVSLGRQVVPKAEIADDAVTNLRILSGRSHRVFTGVCVVTPGGKARQRLVETRIRFKRLSRDDIERYVESGEWQGKAGGYAIQGLPARSSCASSAPIPTSSASRSTRRCRSSRARASWCPGRAPPR